MESKTLKEVLEEIKVFNCAQCGDYHDCPIGATDSTTAFCPVMCNQIESALLEWASDGVLSEKEIDDELEQWVNGGGYGITREKCISLKTALKSKLAEQARIKELFGKLDEPCDDTFASPVTRKKDCWHCYKELKKEYGVSDVK